MRSRAALMLVAGAIVMAGCLTTGGGNGAEQQDECREVLWELEITPGTDTSIPLYTLNDGNKMQRVVAMGFEALGEDLEVPNPQIRVKECDTLILTIINNNRMPHTFHLHGGLQDWTMDGVPYLSQSPIHEGEEFVYRFEDLKAGTYWYHCHVDPAHHIDLGMYGAFIVEERDPPIPTDGDFVLMLDEWDNCHIHAGLGAGDVTDRESGNYAAGDAECFGRKFQDYYAVGGPVGPMSDQMIAICNDPNVPAEIKEALGCTHGDTPPNRTPRSWWYMDHPPYTPVYNTFTINGKAFPDTEPMYFEEGKTYRLRLINVGNEWHAMHIHGHKALVAYRDGYELESKFYVDTISLGPGERYDLIVQADNPGFWMLHDHNGHAGTNDHQDPGGMMTIIAYLGDFAKTVGFDPTGITRAIEVNDFTKEYHEQHGHTHNAKASASTGLPQATLTPSRDAMGLLTYSYS